MSISVIPVIIVKSSTYKFPTWQETKEFKYLVRRSNDPEILHEINKKYNIASIEFIENEYHVKILSKNNIDEKSENIDFESSPTSVTENINSETSSTENISDDSEPIPTENISDDSESSPTENITDSSESSPTGNIIDGSESSPTENIDFGSGHIEIVIDSLETNHNYNSSSNTELVNNEIFKLTDDTETNQTKIIEHELFNQLDIDNDTDSDIELFRADELDITVNEIDETVYTKPTFNIGVFGCLSSGKSTFINSLLGNKYAEMNMCRCTSCPQIYETNKNCKYTESDIIKIRDEIEKINKEKNSSLYEVKNTVPSIDIFNDFNKIEFKIYDIPGLNDCESSEIMYTYMENNFYKFDLIIFNIDINQGLGTKDEIKILETIQIRINENNKKYNRNVKLLIICNKFDDLDNEQLLCQYDQVQKQLNKYKINCPVIKYSSMYTYYYRYLSNKNIQKDDKTLKTLGEKFMGMTWSLETQNKSIDQKMDFIRKYIMDKSKGLLKLSGFDVLCDELQTIIKDNIHDLIYSKINYCTSIKKFKYKYNFIIKLNDIFSHDYNCGMISKYLDQYLEYFERKYNITNIPTIIDGKISKRINKVFNKLKELDSIKLNTIDKSKINKYFDIYYNILADCEISKLINNDITTGDIFNILLQIQKTPNGINKLRDNINYLDKVPMIDFKQMIDQLITFGFDYKVLLKLYSIRIINHYNKSEYSSMVKNYIINKYYETNDEYFNYLNYHIIAQTINEHFNYDKFNSSNLYLHLKEFFDFYSNIE